MPISLMLIQGKALSLFKGLKRKHCQSVADATFNTSHGRLHTFKAQAELHSMKVTGEIATEDMVAATGSLRL
jgi:hypothetical protein